MFSKAKVGEKVWDYTLGWGVISKIDTRSFFKIRVKFNIPKEAEEITYTTQGYKYTDDANQSLFWDEIEFNIPKKPLPDLEIDTKLIVWDNEKHKCPRHFSHFDDSGVLFCFPNGSTSWTSDIGDVDWENWEVVDGNS